MLFVLSLLVHFSAVLNYLILFSIILLYTAANEKSKENKRAYTVIFALSIAATAGLFAFFLLHHTDDLPLSQEEFHRLINDRGGSYVAYYDYSFYYTFFERTVVSPETAAIPSPFMRIVHTVIEKCLFTFRTYAEFPQDAFLRLALAVLLLTPALCFIYKNLSVFFKSLRDSKFKRFCVFLMMAQFPFTAITGCLFSPDIIRWFTHAFLISFTMFLFLIYHEEAVRTEVFKKIESRKYGVPAYIFFLAWFFSNAWPYS